MSLDGHKSLDKMLPDEVLLMIFSQLTVVELARVQQTCKRWYDITQEHSALWRDATAFFSLLDAWNNPEGFNRRNHLLGERVSEINLYGFKKLLDLSKRKLDGLWISLFCVNKEQVVWNDEFCEIIIEALEEHPPTRLTIDSLISDYRLSKANTRCLEHLAKNQFLKHLDLEIETNSSLWSLRLSCSLESLNLRCPCLSKCSNKEDMIQAFTSIKKLKLGSPLDCPGNWEFLEKIGQNLESLELEEKFSLCQATIQAIGPDSKQRVIISFPKLLSLKVESRSHISNTLYKLNCPRLQSLSITGDLSKSKNNGQEISVSEMLISTETISNISVSLSRNEKEFLYKACLERFFGKFRHIKELCLDVGCHAASKDLVDTLPETVSMLAIKISCHEHERGSKLLSNRISRIHRDGGTVNKRRKDDNLICKLDAICWRIPLNNVTYNDLTIFGRANLRALAFGRGR
ncbi:uncharacterized protein FA14DRAFT_154576 [Meira miltonrushii]|uniref:F-box domain-containing protein n=1 Tax=Meira miltonrushii TaxID=1280837 RepID=A0A316VCE5_9BASI|nr:uncharacterized protein FA14DRAFT_154576 [Meira miltonrushii]PWN35150.1 hypothetical protein FA14DRAFT_154576 [Meira miltonrushii]